MNGRTNEQTYERKNENYIPLGINAGGIINKDADQPAHVRFGKLTSKIVL